MCGIAGIWYTDGQTVPPTDIMQATDSLRHRGPDDEGYLFINTATGRYYEGRGNDTILPLNCSAMAPANNFPCNLALGFRRLSILDLSPAGHQPMGTIDGALWIVFNGEIYNYIELREELKACGHTFRTGTDTEVILYAYRQWGESCIERFNGMWAFAIWDTRKRVLLCSRDRFGIKPFYYIWDGRMFAFASEIKALLKLPGAVRRPDDGVIYDYLRNGLLDHLEGTFFAGIKQLPPARCLSVHDGQLRTRKYWDLDPHQRTELPNDSAYAQAFNALFEDAVRLHLRSDVPIGSCLSGGLDSSSIVCVANKLLFTNVVLKPELVGKQQKTFSSCFADPRFDERQYIEHILRATGAESHYTFPSPAKLLQDLPRLIWHQDEPFGSTSIFAQWCVMELAAQTGVKVLLDGQGGDEMLAGYHYYYESYWKSLEAQGQFRKMWQETWAHPRLFCSLLWSRLGNRVGSEVMRALRPYAPQALVAIKRRFKKKEVSEYPLGMNPDFAQAFREHIYRMPAHTGDPFYDLLYEELTCSHLRGLLHYEDRNSMAHSIEARVPFLDYRLVEFAFSLPPEQKIRRAVTKVVLRNAFKDILPEPVRMRTDKMGFVTPESVWMNRELNEWMRDIINSASFSNRGYFNRMEILQSLDEHSAGKRNLGFVAWRWINLELWLRQMIDGR